MTEEAIVRSVEALETIKAFVVVAVVWLVSYSAVLLLKPTTLIRSTPIGVVVRGKGERT